MISNEYCRMMADYNAWQNRSLITAADALSHDERWQDRGAFFKSIARTLNHLVWDDALWLARFLGDERPEETIQPMIDAPAEWSAFKELRTQRDLEIKNWAAALSANDMDEAIGWYPAGGLSRIEKSQSLCVVHFFNHQTHHRGQVHSMLTSAGVSPEATDLPMLERSTTDKACI